MNYDFSKFLKDSQEQCKTKDEFIERISNEIKMVVEIHSDPSSYLEKQMYLKRLEGADFVAKYDQLMEPDKYDEELMMFLYRLS